MIGSANILRPPEAAAAAALLPKFEEAAAAVADATSLPYHCLRWQRQLLQHLMSQIRVILPAAEQSRCESAAKPFID